MDKDIKVNRFHITFHGDRSVGIFDGRWELGEEFHFYSKEDLQGFKDALRLAFSYCADESCIDIQTDGELSEEQMKEEKMWASADEADMRI